MLLLSTVGPSLKTLGILVVEVAVSIIVCVKDVLVCVTVICANSTMPFAGIVAGTPRLVDSLAAKAGIEGVSVILAQSSVAGVITCVSTLTLT